MKFKLPFDIQESDLQLDAHSKIVLIGSCFADNISRKMEGLELRTLCNPFGTVFHPLPIATQLRASIHEDQIVNVLFSRDIYFDWFSASTIADLSEEALVNLITEKRELTRGVLSDADALIISFGTAWGYTLHGGIDVVANCHKQPGTEFKKQLSEINELYDVWRALIEDLIAFNPKLKIVFTVSPVRHVKDGLIENNRSKARLVEFVHLICEQSAAIYFPAYEILIDELRDYRFYDQDLVHPNNLAVDYIFKAFIDFAYSEKGKLELAEIQSYINLREHRTIHNFSKEEEKRQIKLMSLREKIQVKYPWME